MYGVVWMEWVVWRVGRRKKMPQLLLPFVLGRPLLRYLRRINLLHLTIGRWGPAAVFGVLESQIPFLPKDHQVVVGVAWN